jgi:leader peptidase (prepilin peptidase)/N-methyltransferase
MDMLSLLLMKGCLFAILLTTASVYDLRTREIPNWISLALLLTGCLQLHLASALFGLFLTGAPYLIAAMITNGKIGGGDIKLMAACGFVLGAGGGLLQSIIGLTLVLLAAVGIALCNSIPSAKKTVFPLAPFLSAGGFFAFILTHV